MADTPNLPAAAWARIELVKRGAAQKRVRDVRLARHEFNRAKSLDTGTAVDPTAHWQDYQYGLIYAHADYLASVFLATAKELWKIKGADLGVEELNLIFLELRNKSCMEWLESGGDAEYRDYFFRAAVAAFKNDSHYLNLLKAMADSEPNREAEAQPATAATGGKGGAATPIHGIVKGAMVDDPFSDPEISRQIKAKILRLQAASLEWDDNPVGRGFDDHIVETLVESLNAHAEPYLPKVDSEDLISQYGEYMRRVGSVLIRNAEQRGLLSDQYSEDRLRQMAGNSGRFMNRIRSLTPEQQEAEIRNEVERLRAELMPEAAAWYQWRNQIRSRIEARFEARYRRWEADAIERLPNRGIAEGAMGGSKSIESLKAGIDDDVKALVNTAPKAEDVAPAQPATVATGGKGGAPWKTVEICFLDAEHAQVTVLDRVSRLSYAEMGFGDRRGMKVGDRGPNKAWGWLRTFAERGTIDLPERRGAPAPKGPRDAVRQPKSSHEVLIAEHAGAAKAREKLNVAMKGLRRSLCSHFGIKDNPILFEGTRYRAQFRIGCSPSYHQ